jgi:SAM-dependent methyltransferase
VLEFLDDLADQHVLVKGNARSTNPDGTATSFLDLGTGNGHLLSELRVSRWAGPMLGVDYSMASVTLARQIETARLREGQTAEADEDDEERVSCFAPIEFQEHDLLSPDSSVSQTFDVLLDKGTFDAISLSSEVDSEGRRTSEQYRSRIKPFLRNGGLFVITSCNWTEDELRKWFETDVQDEAGVFRFDSRIRYPSFRFGGQEGQSVVTLCFKKQAT